MLMRALQIFAAFSLLSVAWLVQAASKETITIIDMENRRVEVPRGPSRIICLGPGSLRLICYLGMRDKVIGVENFEKTRPVGRTYLIAHPALAKKPPIGPGGPASINKEPDLEAVLKVNPELIFVANMDAPKADGMQKKLGIPVVILSYGGFATFDEIVFDSLRLAGKILLADKRAEEIIAYIENARRDLLNRSKKYDERGKLRVYIGAIGFRGTQGIESTDASYFPLDWIRAKNLAKEVAPKGHLFIDKEKLLSWDPDLIFLDGGGLNLVRQDYQKKPEFYSNLKAFRDKRVFILYPYNWYVTNIDTAVVDAYVAGKILHPKFFADIEPEKKADEIYTFFLRKPVYKQMEKEFGEIGRGPRF
jgi:iron complex transport system substrate-binding protein